MVRNKKNYLFVSVVLLSLAIILLAGCATTPKYLSSDDASKIKNIAIETTLEDNGLCVLDIAGIRKQEYSRQYGGVMFGAIEALIIEGVSSHKINSMIGGSIEPIKESVADFNMKSTFDSTFYKKFSELIKENTDIQNIIMLKENDSSGTATAPDIATPSTQTNNQPDALLKIDYKYGIGAFVEKKPLPAVIARVSVLRLPESTKLMSDIVIMYSCDDNNYTLDDYAQNKGKIYRQCFNEIADKLGERIVGFYFPSTKGKDKPDENVLPTSSNPAPQNEDKI
ncbi:MAG TPA: hypothetical protein VMB78_10470 [Dissulfurispiraceae bacterium]|nr:hypothetical protein [Dissulfurispiraceae bacterium]